MSKGMQAAGLAVMMLAAAAVPLTARSTEDTPAAVRTAPEASRDRDAPQKVNDGAPSTYCVQRFLEPLKSLHPSTLSQVSGPWNEVIQSAMEERKAQLGIELSAVVATLPDPIESGLGYAYESALSALRLGVEHPRAGLPRYLRDRSWLAWDDPGASKNADSEACWRSMPSVVLFRSASQEQHMLALLLVGETPTTGVHVPAMVRALEIAKEIRNADAVCVDGGSGPGVNIVGPSFSGTSHSLSLAIETAFAPSAPLESVPDEPLCEQPASWAPAIRVATGSASGSGVAPTLEGSNLMPGASVSFTSTATLQSVLQCAYYKFICYHLLGWAGRCEERGLGLPRVAMLHESGTEFGDSGAASAVAGSSATCDLGATVDLSFPPQIAALRDAYEQMDKEHRTDAAAIGRRTSLDLSTSEQRPALDFGMRASKKTTAALDIALRNVLSAVSRNGIEHVAITATDVADAIFLVRKIRDVSPSVRIAILKSDALIQDIRYRRDLLGTLVVSSYPFMGSNDLSTNYPAQKPETEPNSRGAPTAVASPIAPVAHRPFPSGASLGIFNATNVALGGSAEDLVEYLFTSRQAVSPVWITAVGRDALVPVSLHPAVAQGSHMFGSDDTGFRAGATFSAGTETPARSAWWHLRGSTLRFVASAKPARAWHFLCLCWSIAFILDALLNGRRATFWEVNKPAEVAPPFAEPITMSAEVNIEAQRMGIQWSIASAARSFAFTFGLVYAAVIYFLALKVYEGSEFCISSFMLVFTSGLAALAALYTVRHLARAGRGYVSLFESVRDLKGVLNSTRALPEQQNKLGAQASVSWLPSITPVDRVMQPLGLAYLEGSEQTAATSLARVRLFGLFAACAAVVAIVVQVWSLPDFTHSDANPSVALYTSRTMALLDGVSPAFPTFACLGIVYLWALGREQRLREARALALLTPSSGLRDCVSAPIWLLLDADSQSVNPARLARAERKATNAVVHPISGLYFASAFVAIGSVPVAIFALNPLSTLESRWGNVALMLGVGLCTAIIGNTLLQFVQYWDALQGALKRILQDPLGRAFSNVDAYVRDTVADQIAGSPHDLLRYCACAERLDELIRAGAELGQNGVGATERAELETARGALLAAQQYALASSMSRDRRKVYAAEYALGRTVIQTARPLARLVNAAYRGPLPHRVDAAKFDASSKDEERKPLSASDTALAAEAWRYSAREIKWLRAAEAFLATLTALLLRRHVRQFRYFIVTLTLCASLFVLALTSYVFEPERLLLTFAWLVVGSICAIGLWIYVQLERNALLSRIAGTAAGSVTIDGALIWRILVWVAVPMLAVTAAQYPDLANALHRIFEPLTRALN